MLGFQLLLIIVTAPPLIMSCQTSLSHPHPTTTIPRYQALDTPRLPLLLPSNSTAEDKCFQVFWAKKGALQAELTQQSQLITASASGPPTMTARTATSNAGIPTEFTAELWAMHDPVLWSATGSSWPAQDQDTCTLSSCASLLHPKNPFFYSLTPTSLTLF